MPGIVGGCSGSSRITLSVRWRFAIVSLTLTPMMCARFLEAEGKKATWPLVSRDRKECSKPCSARTERGLQWVLRHQALTLGWLFATWWPPSGLHHCAQGPAAAAGHRFDHRRHRFGAIDLVPGDGPAPACHRGHRPQRPDVGERGVVSGRDGERHVEFRPALLSTSSRATSAKPARARSSTRLREATRDVEEFPSSCRGAGRANRQPRQPHASINIRCRTADESELAAWAPKLLGRLRAQPELTDVATDQHPAGCKSAWTWTARRPRA